jgi:CheY-like chemotaxis protein
MTKVLYIEDNDINRFVFQKMIEGYADVSLANNGYEGLKTLENGNFDLIFLDLNLNDSSMDGFEVIKRIRERSLLDNGRQKVIALTAYVSPEWRNRCSEAGFDGFVGKPIKPEEIKQYVDNKLAN